MNALLWLIVAHAVGDWLLQTQYEALGKASGKFLNLPLAKHCVVYTLCFLVAFALLHVPLWWLAPIFASHYLIDRRTPVIWWVKTVKQTNIEQLPENLRMMLMMVVDQIFHLLVLVLIALAA